jgi:hypothetical protein
MRPGYIDLDLQHLEFLTEHDPDTVGEFNKLSHKQRAGVAADQLHRDGDPDPKALAHGAHPGGAPIRIARDRISGLMFANVAENFPSDADTPRQAKRAERITGLKPFHVPGSGYWVPLKEIMPDHPHAQSEPIREAHKAS